MLAKQKTFEMNRKLERLQKPMTKENRDRTTNPVGWKQHVALSNTDCESQRVRKKRRVSAILTSIQIHEFDFMFSCPVLQFDLRVFMNMDIWFCFYLYPWWCDVTRYIRAFIYLHNTSLSEWMPDGAWPILDECSHVVIAMSKSRTA